LRHARRRRSAASRRSPGAEVLRASVVREQRHVSGARPGRNNSNTKEEPMHRLFAFAFGIALAVATPAAAETEQQRLLLDDRRPLDLYLFTCDFDPGAAKTARGGVAEFVAKYPTHIFALAFNGAVAAMAGGDLATIDPTVQIAPGVIAMEKVLP